MDERSEHRFHLWGWIVFVVCAFFFIATTALAGDVLGVIASLLFLLACVLFLIPLLAKDRARKRDSREDY
ncbi:MAG: hypothetical protein WD489_08675 [Rhodovibrionaceae bacterium]